jgi:hypothetical protein
MTVNNEFEGIWAEVIVANIEALLRPWPGRTTGNLGHGI